MTGEGGRGRGEGYSANAKSRTTDRSALQAQRNWLRKRLVMDFTELPRFYRRLGELYEQQGSRDKAVEYYGKFVELWQDADPEFQSEVRDVKQRMAWLGGEKP